MNRASITHNPNAVVHKKTYKDFNATLARKTAEDINDKLIIGDSIVGAILASQFDVISVSGERIFNLC